jgi:hypothetical protein
VSSRKRLERIESSVTPKQAVLLWLKEVQQFDLNEYWEKIVNAPLSEAPRVRVPKMAEKAVRDSLSKKGMKPALIARAEWEARKQADSLVVLVLNLNHQVQQNALQNGPRLAYLWVKMQWLGEQFDEHDVFNAEEWGTWRTVLIDTLARMWLLRATIATVSEQHYDNHSVLFPDQASDLIQCIQSAEFMANLYNDLEGGLPSWTAIDLAALQSLTDAQVPAAVSERLADAKAAALQAVGEWSAAHDLRKRYALRKIEKLHSSPAMAKVPE